MSAPWKVDYPKGWRWTTEDAEFERLDGWLSGFLWGLLCAGVIVLAVVIV